MRFCKSETYASYWFLSFNSFLGKRGDSYDRFLIRVREMYESINIVFQVLSNLISTPLKFELNSQNTKLNFFSFFEFLYKHRKDSINKIVKYNSMEGLISHFKK
jgi:NADH:ubiquinone oxidoreductase subunit D